MRKVIVVGLLALLTYQGAEAQLNMTQLGSKTYGDELNDIWGYVDSLGNEYALVGAKDGVSIVDVTDPANPNEIWWFNGPYTTWRDLKVWNKHCYVTNESSQGLFIIDLSNLPDTSAPTTSWYTGSTYPWQSAHNLYIDENGVCYIMGADFSVGGAILLDVDTDPMNPIELGLFDTYYLHDGMARGDTLWGGAINDGIFVAVDVSIKSNPVILAGQQTPSAFCHNAWIDDAGDFLYTTDEKKNAYIGAYDVSDIMNITEVDRIRSSPGSGPIPHNTHYLNDYVITSYYRDGVTVHDVTHPDNMIEVANYDTYAGGGDGFNGAWGVYPWLPSGNIIVSNIEDGLSIHGITYVRGCYLEGTVTDLFTSNPITNAVVNIIGTNVQQTATNLTGGYKTGYGALGAYQVEFSAPGYITDTLTAALTNGNITILDAQLSSLPSFAQSGTVQTTGGTAISGADVVISNDDFTFNLTTDGSGSFSIPTFYQGTYDITVGMWNYITDCSNDTYVDQTTGNLVYSLDSGYYDDFSFDFGWTVAATAPDGVWELGEPLGTTYQGDPANPEEDVTGDCSDQAYVTGNTGQDYWDDDVDDGTTTLTSPAMNLLFYQDPYVEYSTWWFNEGGGGIPDDTLRISISDGTTSVVMEEISGSGTVASWTPSSFRILDYISPLSATIRLIVETGDDPSSGHLVEAGIDAFRVFDSIVVSVPEPGIGELELGTVPNPFSTSLTVRYKLNQVNSAKLVMVDVTGRVVLTQALEALSEQLVITPDVAPGAYILQLVNEGRVVKTGKVVKQ